MKAEKKADMGRTKGPKGVQKDTARLFWLAMIVRLFSINVAKRKHNDMKGHHFII